MITKQQKGEIIKEIQKEAEKSEFLAFVNFHGLNTTLATEARRALRAVGANYKVVKKTLLKKALEVLKVEGEMPNLEGEIAVAFSGQDSLAPARLLHQFLKKNKVGQFVGGVFGKKYIGAKEVIAYAVIPSREVLLGQFVNVINSPIQGLVIALNERAKKMSV